VQVEGVEMMVVEEMGDCVVEVEVEEGQGGVPFSFCVPC